MGDAVIDRPLRGIRVLDLGMFWAGPYCGRMLGEAGADVIKVESQRRSDPLRMQGRGLFPGGDPGERPWNRSGMVNERNRSKRSLVIDLTSEEGSAIFKRLVAVSDLVIENFSMGVMERFGLGYEQLKAVNPKIVMISITSQGLSGPEAHYVSYGTTLEQNGGLFAITGYPQRTPGFSSLAFPDPVGGMAAAGLALAALREVRRTGRGSHVDISQRELTTHFVGEAFMEAAITGKAPGPIGNRHARHAPQGAYQCAGDDRWLTLTVVDDARWAALCELIGDPDLASRHASVDARREHHDAIDDAITAWAAEQQLDPALAALRAAGIMAGPVMNAADLYADPQLAARDYFEPIDDYEAGSNRYITRPYRISGVTLDSERPTPLFGQHNAELLKELLGLDDDAIAGLEERDVIGDEPQQLTAGRASQ
ncbi:MAG: CoA transferase [Dehalococcoidia bacterium]